MKNKFYFLLLYLFITSIASAQIVFSPLIEQTINTWENQTSNRITMLKAHYCKKNWKNLESGARQSQQFFAKLRTFLANTVLSKNTN